jgi:uncharacterized protein HemX
MPSLPKKKSPTKTPKKAPKKTPKKTPKNTPKKTPGKSKELEEAQKKRNLFLKAYAVYCAAVLGFGTVYFFRILKHVDNTPDDTDAYNYLRKMVPLVPDGVITEILAALRKSDK